MTEGEPPLTADQGDNGSSPGKPKRIRRWLGKQAQDGCDGCDGCDLLDGCDGCDGCDLFLVGLLQVLFVRGRRPHPVVVPPELQNDRGLSRPVRLSLALLRGYKRWLSAWLPTVCRYEPSCSAYAAVAVRRFGVRRGIPLAYRRIRRCNPSGGRGHDPVPVPVPVPVPDAGALRTATVTGAQRHRIGRSSG